LPAGQGKINFQVYVKEKKKENKARVCKGNKIKTLSEESAVKKLKSATYVAYVCSRSCLRSLPFFRPVSFSLSLHVFRFVLVGVALNELNAGQQNL